MVAPAPEPSPQPSPRGRRGYWVPGLIALTVLLAIGALIGAGDLDHGAPTTLAGADMAAQIAIGVQVQQKESAPPQVDCPRTEPARTGLHFVCSLQSSGKRQTIDVTEIDSRGHLRWRLAGP